MASAGGPQRHTGRGPDEAIIIEARTSLDGIPLENRALAERFATVGQPWRKERQSLVKQDDRQYDVITVRFADGTSQDVWFDITSFFGEFGAMLVPSPSTAPPWITPQAPVLPPFPREIEDAIAEAVVRYQLRDFRGQIAFLIYKRPGEESTDPSDTFLARFAGQRPLVKKESDSTMVVPREEPQRRSLLQRLLGKEPPPPPPRSFYERQPQIVDRATSQGGTKFRIGAIRRLADDRADVEGGWYGGGQAAWDGIYHLRHEDGRWLVYDETMTARL